MKRDQARQFLAQGLTELHQARQHLGYSFQQVAGLPEALEGVTANQLERVEAFSSRFARTVDLLVHKVLRSLDRVELNPKERYSTWSMEPKSGDLSLVPRIYVR
jgi:hypothetical protein